MDKTENVLVTGGCGFIGTWVLRELLAGGHRPVVLDPGARPARWDRLLGPAGRGIPLLQGSLLDRDVLTAAFAHHDCTRVVHLAALLTPACQADPWEGCRVNVLGTVALLEQVRAAGGRVRGFSYASSVAVFGDEPDHAAGARGEGGSGRAAGTAGSQPLTFYGVFKQAMERLAAQYWREFGVASVGLRPQIAYGPEREAGLTAGPSLAARAAARGETAHIGYTGTVGYDYVEDVARAFVRAALETPAGAEVLDLPGPLASIHEVVSAILAAAPDAAGRITAGGPALPAHAPPHPRFIQTRYPDWKTTSLQEGMARTVAFYRNPGAGPAPS